MLRNAVYGREIGRRCRRVTDNASLEVFSRFFGRSIENSRHDESVYTGPTYATMELHFRKSNRENRQAGASSQLHCLYERANNGTTHFLCEYILTIASRSRTCRQANTYNDACGSLPRSILARVPRSSIPLPFKTRRSFPFASNFQSVSLSENKTKKRRRIESFLESMTFPNSIFSPASNNEGEGRNSVPKAAKPLDEGGSSRKTPTIPLIRLECRY